LIISPKSNDKIDDIKLIKKEYLKIIFNIKNPHKSNNY